MSSPDAPIEKRSGIDAIFDASTTSPMLRPKPLAVRVMNQTLNMKSSLLEWNIAISTPRELVSGSLTLMDANDHPLTVYIGHFQLTQF